MRVEYPACSPKDDHGGLLDATMCGERTLFAFSTFGMSTKAYPLLFVESLSVGKRTEVTVPGPRIPW
jgi:hypothetical protein